MCKICIDWEKGKMTSREALRAAGEIMYGTNEKNAEHAAEVVEKIMAKEVPSGTDPDPELDAEYERKNRGSD
jgi:hypothetical protein